MNFAENQDEYLTLPALRIGNATDTVITCQSLSIKERLKVLFTGRIWMSELNFYKPLTPRYFSVNKKDMFDTK